jgi:hypothetical protein
MRRQRGRPAGNHTLRLPPERRLELLAVLADERPMQVLLAELRAGGFGVDVAHDLAGARQLFFGAGGHDCLLIGPDVSPGVANAVVASLREVDPELPAVTFGPVLPRAAGRRTAAVKLHPSSRAGVGALLRCLRDLPERS